jgi:ATP-binding cassette subfamily B protein
MKTLRLLGRIGAYRPWLFALNVLARVFVYGCLFQATGLVQKEFFDVLGGAGRLGLDVFAVCALLVAIAVARAVFILGGIALEWTWNYLGASLLRRNLFERILAKPGARALPGSTGDAINCFRDDVDHIVGFCDFLLFLAGTLAFSVVALVVMVRIDPLVTVVVFLPLVLVVSAANLAMKRIEAYRRASREATGAVTGFLGELFGSIQAVKTAGAETRVISRFERLNEKRRVAALRDRLLNQLFGSVFWNTVNLGTGIILLLSGSSIARGAFTVGDFSLFVYYLGFVTNLVAMVGMAMAQHKQAGVAFERLAALLQGDPPEALVRHVPIRLRGETSTQTRLPRGGADRLERLETRGLSYLYPGTDRGIHGIDLRVERGELVVITGRVGSGKSCLLKTLLGLLPADSGVTLWNGSRVEDAASFFVPPRCAYTAQVPRLFSESLRDNILLGLPEAEVDLPAAIRAAVLEQDIPELEHGLDTLVGTRGTKLSGGQVQRTAAARMFVRDPEFLVFDDLSSALDVDTERALWERLGDGRARRTCLVVSNRRAAFRRASRILVLRDGRIEDQGRFEELLDRCEEMRRLSGIEDAAAAPPA